MAIQGAKSDITTVAVITTGGTIGSVAEGATRRVDADGWSTVNRVGQHCNELGVQLVAVSALNKISENLEPPDWALILQSVQQCVDQGYDNIVVTHGTDTLPYTANAVDLAIEAEDARIVFTASLYGPDHEGSDVEIALRSAVEASVDPRIPPGVYICFRSPASSQVTELHFARSAKPLSMDDTGFRSLFDRAFGRFCWNEGWKIDAERARAEFPAKCSFGRPPDTSAMIRQLGKVRLTFAVPGLIISDANDVSAYPKALVVGLYHSGTSSVSKHKGGLRDFVRESQGVTETVLVGMASELVPLPYESIEVLVNEGARCRVDVQPHVVYVGLYLGLALGMSVEDSLERLPGSRLTFNRSVGGQAYVG